MFNKIKLIRLLFFAFINCPTFFKMARPLLKEFVKTNRSGAAEDT